MPKKIDAKTVALSGAKGTAEALAVIGFLTGIRSITQYTETRQDLDFGNNNLNCTAAYRHEREDIKSNFVGFWVLFIAIGLTGFAIHMLRAKVKARMEEEGTRLVDTVPDRKVDGKTIAAGVGIGVVAGLTIDGFMAGIRAALEFSETRQDLDFDNNNLNCTAAYEHERQDFRANFIGFWAILAVGTLFGASFYLGRALRNATKQVNRDAEANTNPNPSTNSSYS